MKELMKSNIYDCEDSIIICGSCLQNMQPIAYEKLEKMSLPIYHICLEEIHVNMAITKILGMIRTKKVSKIIFASVDKSPHCIQLHYIQDEIVKLGLSVEIVNYIAVDNSLIEISKNAIKLSKNLCELNKLI